MSQEQSALITEMLDPGAVEAARPIFSVYPELMQMRAPQTPDSIGLWPLAPGWWLTVLSLVSLALLTLAWRRHRRRANQFRRESRQLLTDAFNQWRQDQDKAQYLAQVLTVVRRTALTIRPRGQVARQTGPDWVRHLNAMSGIPLSDATARALTQQSYQPKPNADIEAVHQNLVQWLTQLSAKHD